ncbi:hypothetical protein KIPB_013059, partial [Kipferlia bialata]|eukprot:g13059.t1
MSLFVACVVDLHDAVVTIPGFSSTLAKAIRNDLRHLYIVDAGREYQAYVKDLSDDDLVTHVCTCVAPLRSWQFRGTADLAADYEVDFRVSFQKSGRGGPRPYIGQLVLGLYALSDPTKDASK